jgi:methylenetetrahydrofolate dehydrogenase (NADP+)/methenyltetrahydrofolate cyclohydrolase
MILDGKQLAQTIKEEIAADVTKMKADGRKTPHLVAVLVGHDGASQTYVNSKVKSCEKVGIKSTLVHFDAGISEAQLMEKVDELNHDDDVDGFIVQLPLPDHISEDNVNQAIWPSKDVDGFTPVNQGRLAQGLPAYIPATPMGIMLLLERNNIDTEGKHCVVLGRSNIVGLPMSLLMARKGNPGNCTVTICHSRTADLKSHTLQADILVAALGAPEFVTGDMVKEGVVVIDVGITRVTDETAERGYRLKGDVKYDEVSQKSSAITPVPGGVGPMTVTSLLLNTLKAANKEIYP